MCTFPGLHTYSGDERLSINFEQPNNWKLRIKPVKEDDEGHYQCQVSSHPPIVLHVTLTVIGKSLRTGTCARTMKRSCD